MALIEIGETSKRRASIGPNWARTYERNWIIQADRADGHATVLGYVPVHRGDVFEFGTDVDLGSYCDSIDIDCYEESPTVAFWSATARYGPLDIEALQPKDPTERPIKVSWSFARFEAVVLVSQLGNRVLNTAGDPYDPPLTKDDCRPILTIIRNQKTFDPLFSYEYINTVNLDEWWGVEPGIVKVLDIAAELTHDPDIGWYYVVTYQFEFRKEGWRPIIIEMGYRQLNATSGQLEQIRIKGEAITSPARLDEDGHHITDPDAEDFFTEYTIYEERSFAPFGLDPSQIPGAA